MMNDHARAFFEAGKLAAGLELTVRVLHHRIRSAVLGRRFDPRILEFIAKHRHLSGGAGASAAVSLGIRADPFVHDRLDAKARPRFAAQPSPEHTQLRYLEWVARGQFDPDVGIFTVESRGFLLRFPMTRAYFDWILLHQHGRAYAVDRRGDLALIYFTDDPFPAPRLLRRVAPGWQLDVVAAVRDVRLLTHASYNWEWVGVDDDYSRAFATRIASVNGVRRIVVGDNRPLPIRRSGPR